MEHLEIAAKTSTVDAVADGMMVAYAHQMKNKDHSYYERRPLEHFFEESTNGNCFYASVDTLYFLTVKYRGLFDYAFLLSSEEFEKGSPIHQRGQNFHSYALIHGKDGFWYAASPANHDSTKKNAYALEMIREQKLEGVLGKIKERDGGAWPSASEIILMIKGKHYERPSASKGKHELDVFEITMDAQGFSGMMTHETPNIVVP